jgi:DNA repair protein RadC
MTNFPSRITDWPEDERPRERFLKYGPERISDVELLTIILRTGSLNATAFDIARELLQKYGNFRGIDQRSIADLCEIKGVGEAKAILIKAALETGKRLFLETFNEKQKISTSEEIYDLFRLHLRDSDREIFKIILLTSRNQIILEKTIFEGSLTESLVNPREVVKEALNHAAAGIIFVHNHPSGDPSPSMEDKQITTRLKMACELIGIRVLDHVIVGRETYFSFSDNGLV